MKRLTTFYMYNIKNLFLETINFFSFSFLFFGFEPSFVPLTSIEPLDVLNMANESFKYFSIHNALDSSFFIGAISSPYGTTFILHFFIALTLNLAALVWSTVKIFKVLLYMKMAMEFFPVINPYVWPYSILLWLTNWYFSFWRVFLPPLRLKRSSVSIPVFVAIEALTPILYFSLHLVNFCTDWLLLLDKA